LFPDPHFDATHSVVKIDHAATGETTFTVTSNFMGVFGACTKGVVNKVGMAVEGKGRIVVQTASSS